MFQVLFALIIGVIIGWNFHLFYSSLEPNLQPSSEKKFWERQTALATQSNREPNHSEASQPLAAVSTVTVESNQTNDSDFYTLLYQNHFSDAMALYLEADESTLREYKLILKAYFYDLANRDPIKTIEEIRHYIEIDPVDIEMRLYLAELYRDKQEFEKALDVLFELYDLQDETYLSQVENDLNSTIETYIEQLKENKNFARLISLLEELIDKNLYNGKYTMRLAELYYELESYRQAQALLEEIAYDPTYGAKAQTLLNTIEGKKKEQQYYSHMIPLGKAKSQYTIEVLINSTPLTLLLDTGASYTFLDEDKIPSLQIEKEIFLNTAGGEIVAHLAKADSIRVQDLELTDFAVTLAPFKRQNADGLLGMNFFSQFDFKIDQDKQLLYLKKKSNK